jgi:hypothetical protein
VSGLIDRIRAWFGGRPPALAPPGAEVAMANLKVVPASENPFGVPVLDVAPLTTALRANPKDPSHKADSWSSLAASALPRELPPGLPKTSLNLRYPLDVGRRLPEGYLFRPQSPEEKWALVFHSDRIWFYRSWTGELVAIARGHREDGPTGAQFVLDELEGDLDLARTADPDFVRRICDFLVRAHALGEILPAPWPRRLRERPGDAGLWAFAWFGRRCLALSEAAPPPARHPLRVDGPLFDAARSGDLPSLQAALDSGADLEARSPFFGYTPLHGACAMGEAPATLALIRHGAPLETRADDGSTPLLAAAAQHGPDTTTVISHLIAAGANLSARDARGNTALHLVIQAGRPALAGRLLGAGADPTAVTEAGFSALHMAAELGQADVCNLLIGAPPPQGAVPLPSKLAHDRGHLDLAAWLVERGR